MKKPVIVIRNTVCYVFGRLRRHLGFFYFEVTRAMYTSAIYVSYIYVAIFEAKNMNGPDTGSYHRQKMRY